MSGTGEQGSVVPMVYNSSNQQSLVLECSVCAEEYEQKFNDQPRSLRCGHTFCTGCCMRLMTTRGVSCPVCSRFHQLPAPDVMMLPMNHAVLEIVKSMAKGEIAQQPDICAVCDKIAATVICVDCLPGTQFKFCDKCDRDEHMRNFGPARRHKRYPIDDPPSPNIDTFCPRHTSVAATLYSCTLAEFGCHLCQQDPNWVQSHAMHFEPVHEVTEKLQGRVKKLTKYSNDMVVKLKESKQNLETIENGLEPSAMDVRTQITETFTRCVELLQERQRTLLANVDIELKNRIKGLRKQSDVISSTIPKFRSTYQDLSSLTSKSGANFISSYQASIKDIESNLALENKSILRPLVTRDIPFCMSNIEQQLQNLGAVGGGTSPIDLGAIPKGPRGTLMQLYWQLPEDCDRLQRFQIEYEQVLDSIEQRGSWSGVLEDSKEDEKEPQYYEVLGNELSAYVDYLCVGYTYRFRIRSANEAGFGMWSDPITAQTVGFPFTLEYTKKIHRITIPAFGSYRITVKGAKAADGLMHKGGRGAVISAVVSLKAGDVLILLCGGMSSRHHYHSGGGGGSFVVLNEVSQESLLIAAGGGGGTRGADANDFSGSDANIYEDGFDGRGSCFGVGGKNGGPGGDATSSGGEPWSWGGGGAGFMQDSCTAQGFLAGGHGGQNGGFGGGGAVGMYGGGGGGGFSGGGGGRGGGGGGSYVTPTAVDVTRSVGNEDHGSICIEEVVPPYPVSNSFQRASSNSSTGGASTTGSSTNLMSQLSSSSFSTTPKLSTMTSNSDGSNGGTVGVIPEEPELLHQSPSSTEQIETDPPIHFTAVSEVVSMVPNLYVGGPPPMVQVASTMLPAQSAQNMVPKSNVSSQHSKTDFDRRHNISPPMSHHQQLEPVSSSVAVQQPQQQLQQVQQQQLQILQQQHQQLQQSIQPVSQAVPQLRSTTTSPPLTAVQQQSANTGQPPFAYHQ